MAAQPEVQWGTLTASVQDAGTGAETSTLTLRAEGDGWHRGEVPPLPEGTYRITVRGQGDSNPVTDVFAVVDEGTDTEPG